MCPCVHACSVCRLRRGSLNLPAPSSHVARASPNRLASATLHCLRSGLVWPLLTRRCTYAQSMTLTRAAAAAFGPVEEEDALMLLGVAFAVLLPPVAERDGQRPQERGGFSRPGLAAARSSASLPWVPPGNVPSTPSAASDLCAHQFTAPGVVADDAVWRRLHVFDSASPGSSPGGCDPSSACMVDKSSLPTGSRRRMAAGWVSLVLGKGSQH